MSVVKEWHLVGGATADAAPVLCDAEGRERAFDSAAARAEIVRALGDEAVLHVAPGAAEAAMALARLPWAAVTYAQETVPVLASVVGSIEVFDERPAEPVSEPEEDTVVAEAPAPAPDVVPVAAPEVDPQDTIGRRRYELRKAASWYGRNDPRTLAAAAQVREIAGADPKTEAGIARDVQSGDLAFRVVANLETTLRRFGPSSAEGQSALANARKTLAHDRYALRKIDRAVERTEARNARNTSTDSDVTDGGIEHSIPRLAPSPAWTLLVDEGGDFLESESGAPRGGGKVVGLLIPQSVSLPGLPPRWHAVDQTSARAIDHVVQTVLDAPVGVLGIRTDVLVGTLGDAWLASVFELLSWVVRLMPVDGPTKVEVLVEQRGEHKQGTRWQSAAVALRRRLADVAPARAGQIDLRLRLIGKDDSPLNGYVDALAFTWTSPAPASKARLKQSGLRGPCLLNVDRVTGALLRDALLATDAPAPAVWRRLIALPEAVEPTSLVAYVLSRAAEGCRRDAGVWREYLDATRTHLESKAVDLVTVGRQVGFLTACAPANETLPPALSLTWAVARVEAANHRGETDTDATDALMSLGDRLFDEAAPLVCQAELVAAVLHTNAFRFDTASRVLDRWQRVPVAVPGRRHFGRVQSSLGQHAAFRGDHEGAQRHFAAALEAFNGLSDPAQAAAERQHTQTYVAISAMDAPAALGLDARAEVGRCVDLSPEGIRHLAKSRDAGTKYAHHMLVRFVWQWGTPAERALYLEAAGQCDFETSDGHPWPLIGAYRGALLAEANRIDEARTVLRSAVGGALDGGPTMQYIAAVIAMFGARLLGEPRPELGSFEAQLRLALPDAPWAVIDAQATLDARTFWMRALPFNFR
jgi:hypothetical protein